MNWVGVFLCVFVLKKKKNRDQQQTDLLDEQVKQFREHIFIQENQIGNEKKT